MKLAVIMDQLESIHFKKDSTLAMLWEASRRGYEIEYLEQADLFLENGVAYGDAQSLKVFEDPTKWYQLGERRCIPLADFDIILMRKDPPFNEEYIYSTYVLECAERQGVLVVNKPQALRDANEKFFASYFPACSPPHLITRSITKLRAFWQKQGDIVCKPLNVMGGASVFRLRENEINAQVIFETLTQYETVSIIAQKFIPEIKEGDKRILLIDGEAVPYSLARIPQGNDWRGNLAVGAKGIVQPLSKHDKWICEQVGPVLRERKLLFAGIDVIGDYLTEINVTSPTGIRELDAHLKINISQMLFDRIEKYCKV